MPALTPWPLAAPLLWLLVAPLAAVAEPAVHFLDGNAARAAIVDDAREPYFSRLQPLDMAAKTGAALTGSLDAQRLETRRRYQAAVRAFTPDEQIALRAYVQALQPMLHPYPRFARQRWKFLKLANHIEGGLPHTRGEVIVLSEEVTASLTAMRRQLAAEAALMRAGLLLLHEQLHVVQRLQPQRFESLYTQVFRFVRSGPVTLSAELLAHQVVNPDGLNCCWLFPLDSERKKLLLPVLVYAERAERRTLPEDLRMLAVHVEPAEGGYRVVHGADGRARTEDLLQVPDYVRAFPLTRNFYHPSEAAADLFAQLVLYDGLARDRLPPEQASALERDFLPLRNGFRARLGE